jgi:hypothetical protein
MNDGHENVYSSQSGDGAEKHTPPLAERLERSNVSLQQATVRRKEAVMTWLNVAIMNIKLGCA